MKALIEILAAGGGTLFFAIFYNMRGKKLVTAGLGGMLTWSVCLLATDLTGSQYIAYLVSAMVASITAEILARFFKTPTTTFVVPILIPLIPGGGLFYTMSAVVQRDWITFASKGQSTIFLFCMLAAGIMTASSVKKMIEGIIRLQRQTSLERRSHD